MDTLYSRSYRDSFGSFALTLPSMLYMLPPHWMLESGFVLTCLRTPFVVLHIHCAQKFFKKVQNAQWAKTRKKVHLAGQCTVCLEDLNQRFLNFFRMESPRRESDWSEEKISKYGDFSLWSNYATTQTHIWNFAF